MSPVNPCAPCGPGGPGGPAGPGGPGTGGGGGMGGSGGPGGAGGHGPGGEHDGGFVPILQDSLVEGGHFVRSRRRSLEFILNSYYSNID